MQGILERLIAEAAEESDGVVEAQVTFRSNGRDVAGAVRKVRELNGVFELLSVGVRPTQNGSPPEPVMVKVFFRAEDLESVAIPWKDESPRILTPSSRVVMPG